MRPEITDELNKKDVGEFHKSILDSTKALIKRSRQDMSSYYPNWDLQDMVYRGERQWDVDDIDMERKGKPVKMVVPNTYAQVMSFTSFMFLMLTQNRTFFELSPIGQEDYGTKNVDSETLLEYNLRKNTWNQILFQHLLDIGRFGPAILECSWTRQVTHVYITPEPTLVTVNNVEADVRAGSDWKEVIKYEGNLVRSVSPYRFFPDTRYPLVDFQRGEFCGAEEDYSMGQLFDLQEAGEVAGIEFIEALPRDLNRQRGGETRSSIVQSNGNPRVRFDPENRSSNVIVTKCQRWIVPKQFKVDGKPIGPEEHRILYHLWYANDNRLIRCEPALWWHNTFGWTLGHFTPDMQQTVTMGLAGLIYRLQDVINWYVNSHITSVRRVMQNRLVINPQFINTPSLDGEGDIYMRPGIGRSVTDALFQLKVQDVTSGHMGDVDMIGKILEVVTGVNANAMGQYNSGRRSAQEARVVTAGAAGRMKMHGHLIFDTSLAPLAQMMLSNLRQSLSLDQFSRVIGPQAMQANPNRYAEFRGAPEDTIATTDYFTFDSTLASEKGFIAQSLQELLTNIMANPAAAMQLDLDPRAIIEEMQFLRGAGPIGRFSLSKRVATGQAQPLAPMPLQQPTPAVK